MSYDVTDFEQEVIERSKTTPVLVDFWAPWCGPCHILGPTLTKLAENSDDQWVLAKINVDQHPSLAQRFNVRGIPTVKLFIDGEVVDEFVGVVPEQQIRQWLNPHLSRIETP